MDGLTLFWEFESYGDISIKIIVDDLKERLQQFDKRILDITRKEIEDAEQFTMML